MEWYGYRFAAVGTLAELQRCGRLILGAQPIDLFWGQHLQTLPCACDHPAVATKPAFSPTISARAAIACEVLQPARLCSGACIALQLPIHLAAF